MTDDAYPLFGEWLMRTRILQRMAFKTDVASLDPEARAGYFREMGFAAVVEIGELAAEIGWKSWGKDRSLDREAYLKELVDVLHFVANLAVAGGISDAELNAAYSAKMHENLARMESETYSGRRNAEVTA